MFQSKLSLAECDFSFFFHLEERLKSEGIRIVTLAEEKERDPEYAWKLHLLDNETGPDFPRDHLEPFSPRSFKDLWFVKEALDSFFIAKQGDHYIGFSNGRALNDKQFEQGITAIRREYRNRGVATAIKVRVLEYAKRHEYETIYTSHRNTNQSMDAVNTKLGYLPYSYEARLERDLTDVYV